MRCGSTRLDFASELLNHLDIMTGFPKIALTFALVSFGALTAFSQTEVLTNAQIIQLVKAGLGKDLIVNKIKTAEGNYDISVNGLVELKQGGVDDVIVAVIMEKAARQRPAEKPAVTPTTPVASTPASTLAPVTVAGAAKEAVMSAKTIAFVKSSINPSRQGLEKALLSNADWKKLNLTITRYKDTADLFVEIGFVPMSLVTHRYVYRIYDRRTGTVLAAGETTSWGSLSEHLARKVSKSLMDILNN